MYNDGDLHRQTSDSLRAAVFIILSGGLQDAYTYCCRGGGCANAQTGNIVLLSGALFRGEWQTAVKYLIPILAFIMGTAATEAVHIRLKHCKRLHWRQMILLWEIALLLAVGFLPSGADALANALVSFVCAMQVQAFHKLHGHVYASTMCIGNMRSGVEALCAYFKGRDRAILRKALTYFGVVLVFGIGAGLGSMLSGCLGVRGIWLCCGLLWISFLLMFVPET